MQAHILPARQRRGRGWHTGTPPSFDSNRSAPCSHDPHWTLDATPRSDPAVYLSAGADCRPGAPWPGSAPPIDDSVIATFKARFSQYDVAKPAVCNGLNRCTVYKVNPDAPLSPELSLVAVIRTGGGAGACVGAVIMGACLVESHGDASGHRYTSCGTHKALCPLS